MSLTEKTNHEIEAVSWLLEQFKGKAKIEGLVRTWTGSIQEIEGVLHDLETELYLANAVGAQLDIAGSIVHLPRGDLSDANYRTRLRARIRANRSNGTPDDILEVARLMITTNVMAYTDLNLGFLLTVDDTLSEDPEVVAAELNRARPVGINGGLVYTLADDDSTFQFASADAVEYSLVAGFSGEVSSEDSTVELMDNSDFTAWTADDPDDWTVGETLPSREISEVASNEGHGGTGNDACNFYRSGGASAASLRQAQTLVASHGYYMEIDVTYAGSGNLYVVDMGGASTLPTTLYTGITVDTKKFYFIGDPTFDLMLTSGAVAGDFTIDYVSLKAIEGGDWADVEEI